MKVRLLGAMLLIIAGCSGAECRDGQTKCEGSKRYTCLPPSETNDHYRWIVEDCSPGVCLSLRDYAMCALSSSTDPLCLPPAVVVLGNTTQEIHTDVCDGNKLVACDHGYRTNERDCGSQFCVPSLQTGDPANGSLYGFCAVSAEPDPDCLSRCPLDVTDEATGYCRVCDGNVKVLCWRNYRKEQEDCGASATCAEEGAAPVTLTAGCEAR